MKTNTTLPTIKTKEKSIFALNIETKKLSKLKKAKIIADNDIILKKNEGTYIP